MTDLTEQWKKGELPVGSYYASYLGEPRVWLYRDKQNQTYDLEYEIYEVLAKVPSYDEWKNFVDANTSLFDTVKMLEKDNFRLEKQNAQLKDKIERLEKENNDLKNEIKSLYNREEILVRKLNIALDCVLSYSDRKEWKSTENGESCDFGSDGYELAEEALDKIKEVGMIKEFKFKPFSSRLLEQKITDCNLFKKQLDVAVATLELYALEKMYLRDTKTGCEFEFDNIGYSRAKEALKHIKELENA